MSPSYLDPTAQSIVLFEQFIASEEKSLVLKEKILSLSGDSFDIKLENGMPLLKVDGAWPSFSGKKKVEDMSGNHLFDLRKEHMHLHTTYKMEDPDGKMICEVRNNHKFIGSRATANFTDLSGNSVTLVMTGNWNDRSATIVREDTDQWVARISRKRFNARHMFFGQDTYVVTVALGVDMALIAGLCICFDEKNND